MLDIKNHCTSIQNHIKKSKSNLSVFMYTTEGIMFLFMMPFVKLHKKHFRKVEESIEALNSYCKDNNLNMKFENFVEYQNSAVLYSQSQLGALTVKQYDMKIKYLDNFNDMIESLKERI